MADHTGNPSFEWRTHAGNVIRLDYVWATRKYHVWIQPKGDPQAYWIGQASDPKGAEALIKDRLTIWTKTVEVQVRSGITAVSTSSAVA